MKTRAAMLALRLCRPQVGGAQGELPALVLPAGRGGADAVGPRGLPARAPLGRRRPRRKRHLHVSPHSAARCAPTTGQRGGTRAQHQLPLRCCWRRVPVPPGLRQVHQRQGGAPSATLPQDVVLDERAMLGLFAKPVQDVVDVATQQLRKAGPCTVVRERLERAEATSCPRIRLVARETRVRCWRWVLAGDPGGRLCGQPAPAGARARRAGGRRAGATGGGAAAALRRRAQRSVRGSRAAGHRLASSWASE